jgi:N,N'-diacetyllegionaminate synthase
MVMEFKIGDRWIGSDHPCFIIAEIGVNHNGDVKMASELIDAAVRAGADAAKFQTFLPDDVVVPDAPKANYQMATTKAAESQFQMLSRLSLKRKSFANLKDRVERLGMIFLSTPADPKDVEFLVSIGVPAIKVASMDIVNYPLLERIGRTGLPAIVSTGMATLGEIEKGVAVLQREGCDKLVLMHCVTNYPIRDEEANLRVMDTLSRAFGFPVGFSDHTTSAYVPIAAAALGACVIEKHFTLNHALEGPDHASSLEPSDFQRMADGIRAARKALGRCIKKPTASEIDNKRTMRRSLVSSRHLPAETLLAPEHFAFKRPMNGLGAEFMSMLIGQRLKRDLPADSNFKLSDIDWVDCPQGALIGRQEHDHA